MRKTVERNVKVPKYQLAIFDDASDAAAKAEAERKAAEDKAAADKAASDKAAADKAASDKAAADKAAADKAASEREERERERDKRDQEAKDRQEREQREKDEKERQRGKDETQKEYEQRIKDLNEENKSRRQENRELRQTLSSMELRTIRSDVQEIVRAANPVDDSAAKRAIDLFMSDLKDKIKFDEKTGETLGLDQFETWKKDNAFFFKAGGSNGNGTGGKRGNATASGSSQGSGSGGDSDNTSGIPDLSTLKSAAERKEAIQKYKQSLQGAGSGYGRASSKR